MVELYFIHHGYIIKNNDFIIYIINIIIIIISVRIRSVTGSTQPREDNWVATWLRKSTLLDLTERNAYNIIPPYCHLPVSTWPMWLPWEL